MGLHGSTASHSMAVPIRGELSSLLHAAGIVDEQVARMPRLLVAGSKGADVGQGGHIHHLTQA